MAGSQQIAVTPQRVADGDPAALVRLVDRRARAVLGFCETVCTYDVAPLAAAEAFARFRAAVHAATDPRSLDPETLLHGATRHAAGAMARSASSETRRRLGRRGDEHLRCVPTPGLLAARADNMLGVAEDERLSDHLQRCAGCRAVEARFNRAEQAYLRRSSGDIDPVTVLAILEALHDAAPVAPQYEGDWDEVLAGLAQEAGQSIEELDEAPAIAVAPDPEVADPRPEDEAPEAEGEFEDDFNPLADAVEELDEEDDFDPLADAEPQNDRDDEPMTALHVVVPEPSPIRGVVSAGREKLSGALSRAREIELRPRDRDLPRPQGRELPRPFRHTPNEVADHGPVYRYVLPATALFVAALIILAVAGVFSSGGT